MDPYHAIRTSVLAIETHLNQPLTVRDLADRAGYSFWHFQRLFHALTGQSVGAYLRARRLAASVVALQATRRRILDIALEYQFESQAAFTRAFKAAFGQTPGEVRRRRLPVACSPPIVLSVDPADHVPGGSPMQPIIQQLPSRTLVGLETPFISALAETTTNMAVIPELWRRFNERRGEIRHPNGDSAFGLISCTEEEAREETMRYLAGVEVSDPAPALPEDMVMRVLPEGLYAIFTHQGPVSTFDATIRRVYAEWLPQAPYRRAHGPEFERYDARFKGESPDSEFEYAIPVAPKA